MNNNDLTAIYYALTFFLTAVSIASFFMAAFSNKNNNQKINVNYTPNRKIFKNRCVLLSYSAKDRTITCTSLLNVNDCAIVEWKKQPDYLPDKMGDVIFETAFDKIVTTLDDSTVYSDLIKLLRKSFKNIEEKNQRRFKSNRSININEAAEEELANLPGINIATAKKIINRISKKGDYSTVEEMYDEMKIKTHFRAKLFGRLCAEPVIRERKTTKNNSDRLIDL